MLDRIRNEELIERMGIKPIGEKIRISRLRWFGHVMRKDDDDWVKQCMKIDPEGKSIRGNRKTWRKTVDEDMKYKGLKVEDCMDRKAWRRGINQRVKVSDDVCRADRVSLRPNRGVKRMG